MVAKFKISAFHFDASHLSRRFISTLSSTESILILHDKFKHLVSKGNLIQALQFYRNQLHPTGLSDNNVFILPTVVKACSSLHFSSFGLQLQAIVIKSGLDYDPFVSNSFISFYAKISDYDLALQVFDNMPLRDAISWNSIVNCSIRTGYFSNAFQLLKGMYTCGFVPKAEVIASVISVIEGFGYGGLGRVIHGLVIVDERIENEVFVSTSLVDWYFKCGDSGSALRVFDQMDVKNEVSWTAVVAGCSANLEYDMAVGCFRAMQINGVRPNRVTLVTILRAIAELGSCKHGKEIHGYAFRHGFDSDHHFSSSLIHFYCNSRGGEGLKPAKLIFLRSEVKDVVMYSSIIRICSRSGDCIESLKLFNQMRAEGIKPNFITLLAMINGCTNLASLKHGIGTHGYIVKCSMGMDVSVGNALISMYSKCGCLKASHQIFKEMHTTDYVSWSTLIAGYGVHGYGEEALRVFRQMKARGLEADAVTVLAVLSACNHAGLIREGREIFNDIMKEGKMPLSVEHYACQIDLLGKAGEIDDAFSILRTMPMKPSSKIWSSLVSACKTHGHLEIAETLVRNIIKTEPGNAANHTLLSMIYAESGNWCGVEEVRRLMRAQGLNKCCGFSKVSEGF